MPEDYYDRPRRATADNLGLGSEIAAGLSFLSPVMGAVGIGSNILSWILGNDKYDWNKWAEEQKAKVSTDYDSSLKKMEQRTANLADATIGQATNTQGMAGGVAGISSAGTGRLQAQTYANIAGQRDQAIASITNAMENQKANALAAVDKAAYQGSMAEDFNSPNAVTYANNFIKSLQAAPAQDFLGTLFGGGYMGIKSFFQGGSNNKTSKLPIQTTGLENGIYGVIPPTTGWDPRVIRQFK